MIAVIQVNPVSTGVFNGKVPCAVTLCDRLAHNPDAFCSRKLPIGLIDIFGFQIDDHRAGLSVMCLTEYADCAAAGPEFCAAILRSFVPAVIRLLAEQRLIEVQAEKSTSSVYRRI